MMKKTSKLVTLCFVLALALGCAGCGSNYDTPADLGKAWAEAMSNFDKEAMANCYVEEDREEMMGEFAKMEEMAKSKDASDLATTFESATEVTVGGKSYQLITVSIPGTVTVNGKTESKRVTMEKVAVNQDGNWLFSLDEQAAYRKAKRAEKQ